ncbi:MAG TPA: LysM domain-containing protein [Solirubrobacteraceae bacterium]|nr:LysM domain-containing protein [Solirubrobacteraceae bacterium]
MARRSPARLLAPLALVGFVFALGVVLKGSDPDGGGGRPSTTGEKPASSPGARRERTRRSTSRPRGTYVVKAGDTPSSISVKTGVPLAEIERLNPELDPQLLSPGDRVKLRP